MAKAKTATNDFVAKTEEMLAPARALNELALAKLERLVELQLDNTRKYTTVALDSMKAAMAVKDAEGVKSYTEQQAEVARKTAETMVEDGKVLVAMGKEYSEEVQSILKSSFEKVAKAA